MFEKLIVSEPEGADFKNRRSYFMVSSLVVGVLFLAAVVISIFAADIGLGNSNFELTEMLAPVEMAAVEPETPQPRTNQTRTQSQSDLPTRQINMPNLQENPIVPKGISVTQNTQMPRPDIGRFTISTVNGTPGNSNGSGRSTDFGGDGPSGLSQTAPTVSKDPEVEPPPVIKKYPPRRPPTVSKGPLNGIAKSLPKPNYSAAAKAVRAAGKVVVQVTIDERGNVISANAVEGHPMLRADAERAARNAKFSPTTLSDVPVKVTGIITYNFIL